MTLRPQLGSGSASNPLAQRTSIDLAKPSAREFVGERMARMLDRVIFYSLLVLIALAAIPYGTVEPWWESLFVSLVFVLTALWVVEGLLSGSWRVGGRGLLAPLFAVALFAFLQTLPLWWGAGDANVSVKGPVLWRAVSADPHETQRVALELLALALTGGLLLRYTSSRRRLQTLIYLVLGVAVASALFGILRQTTQSTPGFVLPHLQPAFGYGQFINRNHFAFLMEMALGLSLGLVAGGGARREQVSIYMTMAVPVWTALVLANSRGGIFAMLAQMVFVALLWTYVRPPRESFDENDGALASLQRIGSLPVVRVLLVGCLVLGLAVSTIWLGGDPLVNRFESEELRKNVMRVEMWQATWEMIKDHPIAGVGFGGYWAGIPQYHDSSGQWTPQQAHNDYLELLASGGLIGCALAVWFVVAFIRRARGRLRSKDAFRRAACFGALTGLFGVAVHSLVDFGLHITVNALVTVALIVIAAAADDRAEAA